VLISVLLHITTVQNTTQNSSDNLRSAFRQMVSVTEHRQMLGATPFVLHDMLCRVIFLFFVRCCYQQWIKICIAKLHERIFWIPVDRASPQLPRLAFVSFTHGDRICAALSGNSSRTRLMGCIEWPAALAQCVTSNTPAGHSVAAGRVSRCQRAHTSLAKLNY